MKTDATPSVSSTGDAREAFEAWARPRRWDLTRYSPEGDYVASYTRDSLDAWQAATTLAHASQPQAATPQAQGGVCEFDVECVMNQLSASPSAVAAFKRVCAAIASTKDKP